MANNTETLVQDDPRKKLYGYLSQKGEQMDEAKFNADMDTEEGRKALWQRMHDGGMRATWDAFNRQMMPKQQVNKVEDEKKQAAGIAGVNTEDVVSTEGMKVDRSAMGSGNAGGNSQGKPVNTMQGGNSQDVLANTGQSAGQGTANNMQGDSQGKPVNTTQGAGNAMQGEGETKKVNMGYVGGAEQLKRSQVDDGAVDKADEYDKRFVGEGIYAKKYDGMAGNNTAMMGLMGDAGKYLNPMEMSNNRKVPLLDKNGQVVKGVSLKFGEYGVYEQGVKDVANDYFDKIGKGVLDSVTKEQIDSVDPLDIHQDMNSIFAEDQLLAPLANGWKYRKALDPKIVADKVVDRCGDDLSEIAFNLMNISVNGDGEDESQDETAKKTEESKEKDPLDEELRKLFDAKVKDVCDGLSRQILERVYQSYKDEIGVDDSWGYFVQNVATENFAAKLYTIIGDKVLGISDLDRQLREQAYVEYMDNMNSGCEILGYDAGKVGLQAATAAGVLMADSWLYGVGGKFGSAALKGATGLTMEAATSFGQRILVGSITSGSSFAIAGMANNTLQQWGDDARDGIDVMEVLKTGGEEMLKGGAMGASGQVFGFVGGKMAGSGVTRLGKLRNFVAQKFVPFTGEVATFSGMGAIESYIRDGVSLVDYDWQKSFIDNAAMIASMKVGNKLFNVHGKEANGSIEDRIFNDYQRNELKRMGYDFGGIGNEPASSIEQTRKEKQKGASAKMSSKERMEKVKEMLKKIVDDPNVPASWKAGAIMQLTGKMPVVKPADRHEMIDGEGKTIIKIYDADNRLIDQKEMDPVEALKYEDRLQVEETHNKIVTAEKGLTSKLAVLDEAMNGVCDKMRARWNEVITAINDEAAGRKLTKRQEDLCNAVREECKNLVDNGNGLAMQSAMQAVTESTGVDVQDIMENGAKNIDMENEGEVVKVQMALNDYLAKLGEIEAVQEESKKKVSQQIQMRQEGRERGRQMVKESEKDPMIMYNKNKSITEVENELKDKNADLVSRIKNLYNRGSVKGLTDYIEGLRAEDPALADKVQEYVGMLDEMIGVNQQASDNISMMVETEQKRVDDLSFVGEDGKKKMQPYIQKNGSVVYVKSKAGDGTCMVLVTTKDGKPVIDGRTGKPMLMQRRIDDEGMGQEVDIEEYMAGYAKQMETEVYGRLNQISKHHPDTPVKIGVGGKVMAINERDGREVTMMVTGNLPDGRIVVRQAKEGKDGKLVPYGSEMYYKDVDELQRIYDYYNEHRDAAKEETAVDRKVRTPEDVAKEEAEKEAEQKKLAEEAEAAARKAEEERIKEQEKAEAEKKKTEKKVVGVDVKEGVVVDSRDGEEWVVGGVEGDLVRLVHYGIQDGKRVVLGEMDTTKEGVKGMLSKDSQGGTEVGEKRGVEKGMEIEGWNRGKKVVLEVEDVKDGVAKVVSRMEDGKEARYEVPVEQVEYLAGKSKNVRYKEEDSQGEPANTMQGGNSQDVLANTEQGAVVEQPVVTPVEEKSAYDEVPVEVDEKSGEEKKVYTKAPVEVTRKALMERYGDLGEEMVQNVANQMIEDAEKRRKSAGSDPDKMAQALRDRKYWEGVRDYDIQEREAEEREKKYEAAKVKVQNYVTDMLNGWEDRKVTFREVEDAVKTMGEDERRYFDSIADDVDRMVNNLTKRDKARAKGKREKEIGVAEDEIRWRDVDDDVFAKDADTFDELWNEAKEKKGVVTNDLGTAEVKICKLNSNVFSGGTLAEIKEKARAWAKKKLQGLHMIRGNEKQIYSIGARSIDKFINHTSIGKSANIGAHFDVLKKLPEIIDNSIDAEVHVDQRKIDGNRLGGEIVEGSLVHRLYGAVEIDGKMYRVKTTMIEKQNKGSNNVAHSYEVTEIELLDSARMGEEAHPKLLASNNSTISGAKLLKGVEKSYDKGKYLLDESVKSQKKINLGGEKYEVSEVEDMVRGDVSGILDEMGLNIKGVKLIGSRSRGEEREDSDLDILLEYEGDAKEDDVFNAINENPVVINGVRVDINPITRGQSGTMEKWLERDEQRRMEDKVKADDERYMQAVQSGDMETAQRMVMEKADAEIGKDLQLASDEGVVGFQYHRGEVPKKVRTMYAVFNVTPEGFKAAYAGNKTGTPVGVWLDAQPLKSWESDKKKNDDGSYSRYVAGDTGASWTDMFTPERYEQMMKEDPTITKGTRWLYERGGKHGTDIPNFSQMNTRTNEAGEKVKSAKEGALPHNKLIFEIECGMDEDGDLTSYVAENGRFVKKKNQGMAWVGNNKFYFFKTNPNAVGNWGIAGTFRIKRLVPHDEIVRECEKAGVPVQKWVGGYHPEDSGLSVEMVDEMYRQGKQKKLMDPVTYDDNGNVIPLSQRFSGKEDLRFRDDSQGKPVNTSENGFFSPAEKAVREVKQEKATGEQWVKMLEKNGGLKKEEDKWMGLSEWLKDKKSVTKQEVLDFIRENKVEIQEVSYAEEGNISYDDNEKLQELNAEFEELITEGEEATGSIYTDDHRDWAYKQMVDRYGDDFENAFEYDGNKLVPIEDYDGITPQARYFLGMEGKDVPINDTRLGYTTEGLENKREIALVVPSVDEYRGDLPEVHFGDEATGNKAVAWCRFGDYTDKDGKRVLVIDEIQSQRHQDGREKGYASKELSDARNAFKKASDELRKFQMEMQRKYGREVSSMITEEEVAERNRLAKISGEAEEKMLEAARNTNMSGVPDAPFQKNWHELVMKRMLRYAAENGYDRVAWTDGETQASRYGIGGQVEYIDSWDDNNGREDIKRVGIQMKNESHWTFEVNKDGVVANGEYAGKNLSELVGKDIAVRLMQEGSQRVEGEGLQIGGEGMKGFYDQMLPRWMNKYGKKWGVQVGEEFMEGLSDTASGYSVENEGRNGLRMWSVPVTEEMKESVMGGQPMWRKGEGASQGEPVNTTEEVTGGWKVNSMDEDKRHIEEAVINNGNRLNVKVNVLRKGDEKRFSENIQRRLRRGAKGFFDPKTGEVYVYLENATNVGDAVKTMLHEIVGHKGLRELLGKEKFDGIMIDMYGELPDEVKDEINTLAQDKYKGDIAVAMDEYFAGKAEEGVTPTWWGKVTGMFRRVLKDVFGMDLELTDGDIKYLLWKSYKGLRGEKDVFDLAEDISMRFKNKVGEYADKMNDMKDRIMERSGDVTKTDNFKKWFGDWEKDPENASKVVDEEGRPLVVYHGTKGDFTIFEAGRKGTRYVMGMPYEVESQGFFFSADRKDAKEYGSQSNKGKGKAKVIAAYLDMKNPADLSVLTNESEELFKEITGQYPSQYDPLEYDIESWWKIADKEGTEYDIDLVKRLEELGYDGIIFAEKGGQKSYFVIDPTQVKSASVGDEMENNGEFDPKNPDIRYAKEGDKSLVGMHNISQDQLRKVIKLGGLANPSTAIIDIDKQDHEKYGDISLVMPKSMVDSRTGGHEGTNAADIYSPNYPQVYKRFSSENEMKIREKINELAGKYAGRMNVWGSFQSNLEQGRTGGLEYVFAKMKGADVDSFYHAGFDSYWEPYMKYYDGFALRQAMNKDPELAKEITKHFYDQEVNDQFRFIKTKLKPQAGENKIQFFNRCRELARKAADMFIDKEDGQWAWRLIDNEFNSQKKAYTSNGDFDHWETRNKVSDFISKNNLWDEYAKWEEEFVNQYEPKEMLYDGRDREGDVKWVANTLKNASKMMKKQGKINTDGFFKTSMGGVRGEFAPLMKTLEEIRNNKWRLDKEKFEEQKSVMEEQYTELAKLFDKGDSYDWNSKYYNLIDAMKSGNAKKWANKNGFDITDEEGKMVDNFAIALREMPTEYFELKFERPVMLNEFAGAVVPKNTGEDVKEALRNAGLQIFEYDPEVEGDRRRAALEASDMEDVRFRFVGERGAENDEKMKKNLEVAKKMEKDGWRSPDMDMSWEDKVALGLDKGNSFAKWISDQKARRIKMATGWERGKDGKWRYETPDFEGKIDFFGRAQVRDDKDYKRMMELTKKHNGFAFELNEDLTPEEKREYAELREKYKGLGNAQWQKTDKLDKFVKDDMLFKLYPKMRDVEISFRDMKDNEKGALIEPSLDEILNGTAVLPFRIELNSRLTEEEATWVLAHEIQHGVQMMEGFARGGNVESSIKKLREIGHKMGIEKGQKMSIGDMKRMADYLTIDVYNDLLDEALENGYGSIEEWIDGLSPYTYYHRLAGEVEARNVQKRMDMTPEERRRSLAEDTEDVPRERQAVEFDGDGVNSFMTGEKGAQTLDDFMQDRKKKLKWVEKMEKWIGGRDGKESMKEDRMKWEQKFGEEGENRMKNLKVAIRMAKQKKSAKEIKMATGWEQGKDNKWRYEISDANIQERVYNRIAKLSGDKFDVVARLNTIVKAPELFTAYPELEDIPVHFYKDPNSTYGGYARGKEIWINVMDLLNVYDVTKDADYDPEEVKHFVDLEKEGLNETMNHEIQHIIQSIEGFAEGGNTKSVRKLLKDIVDNREWENEDNKKRLEQHGMLIDNAFGLKNCKQLFKNPKRYLKWMDSYKHSGSREGIIAAGQKWAVDAYWQAMDHIEYDAQKYGIDPKEYGLDMEDFTNIVQMRYRNGATPEEVAKSLLYWDEAVKVYDAIVKASNKELSDSEIREDVERYEDVKKKLNKIYDDYDLYRTLAGEVEARAVANRIGMTPEERRNRPAVEDEDVKRSEQIAVRWGRNQLMGEEEGDSQGEPANTMREEDDIRFRDDDGKADKKRRLADRSRRLLEDGAHDWRDYVLISVGGGMKFTMKSRGLTKSIVEHLTGRSRDIPPFMRDNRSGYLPEKAAEHIWESMPEGLKDQCTDQDVFNEIMDIIGSYRNYNEMLDVAERNHFEEMEDMSRYEEQAKDEWAQEQGYADYKAWEASQIWNKMGFRSEEEMMEYEDMLENVYGDSQGKPVNTKKEKEKAVKQWLRDHGFRGEGTFDKWKEDMEKQRRELWTEKRQRIVKENARKKFLENRGFATEEEYENRMDELMRKENARKRLTEKYKAKLQEVMDQYGSEFEFNEDGMPIAPAYSGSENLDAYLEKMDKYGQILKAWNDLHPDSRKVIDESQKIVKRAINVALKRDSITDMGKRELNKLFDDVRRAKSDNISNVVQDALRVVNRVVIREQQDKIDKLLNMKVQDVNGKNMSIAKNVDVRTMRTMNLLREYKNADHNSDWAKEQLSKLSDKMDRYVEKVADGKADTLEDEERWTEADSEMMAALEIVKMIDEGKRTQGDLDELEGQIVATKMKLDELSAVWKDGQYIGSRSQYLARRNALNIKIKALNQKATMVSSMRIEEQDALMKQLDDLTTGGKNELLNKIENEQARRLELMSGAFNDLRGSGKSVNVQETGKYLDEAWYKKMFTAMLSSFEYMCQAVNTKGLGKDGYIYQYFIRSKNGTMAADSEYIANMRKNTDLLNEKCEEIYGKGKTFDKVMEENEKVIDKTGIYVADMDDPDHAERKYEIPMSKAQATYVYMVWKMNDGKAQLELQGFNEDSMDEVVEFIGKENKEWADWVQDKFLQDLRERCNDKYMEIYNTSLANIENYVPLKRVKEMTRQDSDLSGNTRQQSHSLVEKAGSLINRRANNTPIALTNSAFEVVMEHVNQMEEWNAFANVRRDLDYLLGSAYFRNQMNRNNAGSFDRFEKAAEIAAHAERKNEVSAIDDVFAVIQKGLVGAPIAYRNTTALKQMLSVPAFYGYSQDPLFTAMLTANILGQYGRNAPAILGNMVTFGAFGKRMFNDKAKMQGKFKYAMSDTIGWCMENVPDFYARVMKNHAGDNSLDESVRHKIGKMIDKYLEQGMISNQMVDAVTCAIGIKSIYDYKMYKAKQRLKKEDLTPEARRDLLREEHNRAIMDATIYYNGTQQSNHRSFLSPMQVSRTFASRLVAVFQNASAGFARKLATSVQDLNRMAHWNKQVGYYTRKFMDEAVREGVDMNQHEAKTEAQKYLRNEARKKAFEAAWYGIMMNVLWDLGGKGLLGLFRDDDNEEDTIKGMLSDPAYLSTLPLRGTTGANILSGVANGKPMNSLLIDELNNVVKDYKKVNENYGIISPEMAWLTFERGGRMVGFDPKVWLNPALGVQDMISKEGWDGDRAIIDLMFLMNSPESNRVKVAKELYKDRTLEEYLDAVEKAAKYKVENDGWEEWLPALKRLKESDVQKLIKEFTIKSGSEEEKAAYKEYEEFKKRLKEADQDELDRMYDEETDPARKEKIKKAYKKKDKEDHDAGKDINEEKKKELLGKDSDMEDWESAWMTRETSKEMDYESTISRRMSQLRKIKSEYSKLKKESEEKAEKYYDEHEYQLETLKELSDEMTELKDMKKEWYECKQDGDEEGAKGIEKSVRQKLIVMMRK